jgi:hypothetical protein
MSKIGVARMRDGVSGKQDFEKVVSAGRPGDRVCHWVGVVLLSFVAIRIFSFFRCGQL